MEITHNFRNLFEVVEFSEAVNFTFHIRIIAFDAPNQKGNQFETRYKSILGCLCAEHPFVVSIKGKIDNIYISLLSKAKR